MTGDTTSLDLVRLHHPECNLGAFVRASERHDSDDVCIIDLAGPSKRIITYAQLEKDVRQAAGAFRQLGCGRGSRVALALPNSSGFLVAFLALMRLGSIPILLNFKLNADTIAFVLEDSSADGILADPAAMPALMATAESRRFWFKLAVRDVPAGWQSWEEIFENCAPTDTIEAMSFDDQAFQPYTAGSTGVPKGVVLTHGGMLWGIEHSERYWPRNPSERSIVAAPMFHKNAMRGTIKPTLRSGGSVVIMKDFQPRSYLEALAEHHVTNCGGVPAMFALLLKEKDILSSHQFKHLNLISMGSSTVPDELLLRLKEAFPGAEIKEGYGLTEGGAPLRVSLDGSKSPRGSVGKLAPEYEARLVDSDGNVLPTIGELQIRSPYVMKEYANRPDLTRQRLVDGWLRTGDLFRIDADGYYYFVGRNDDMFVCGGENIYPKEVENLILKIPEISEVIVVPLPHTTKGEAPAALAVTHVGSTIDARAVQNYCAANGPAFAIPRAVLITDRLPLTGAGKPDRAEAKRMLLAAFTTPLGKSPFPSQASFT